MRSKTIWVLSCAVFLFSVLLFIPKNSGAQNLELELLSEPVTGNVSSFAISGNNLYLTTGPTMDIFDISNPSSPQKTGTFQDESCNFIEIETAEPDVYMSQSSIYCRPKNSLYILDVTNPSNPTIVGEPLAVEGPGGIEKIISIEGYLYVFYAHGGLLIYDVQDRNNPILEKTIQPTGVDFEFNDGEIIGDRLYIGDFHYGRLWVYEISDKANPELINKIENLESFYGFDIEGNFMYAAGGHPGMKVYDISDLANPIIISLFDN